MSQYIIVHLFRVMLHCVIWDFPKIGGGGVPYLGCPYNKDPTIRGKIFLGRARATRGGGAVVVGWGSALL